MEIDNAIEALAGLANHSRLAVFRLLVRRGREGLSAGELGRRLDIAPNSMSFHLTRLRHAGLLTARRNGRNIIYAVDYRGVGSLMGFLTESCCGDSEAGCSPACPPTGAEETAARRRPKAGRRATYRPSA